MIVAKWDNGTPKKVNYVVGEGVKQEIVGRITYYENGQIIKEETYKDGKLDGRFTGWYESGQKRIAGSYKDGKHRGIWTSWDSSGVKRSFSYWLHKGYVADYNKEYDKAISFYLRSIELKPDDADAYFNMGIAYNNQGNYPKAIESYEKAIDLKPDYASAYNNMGNAYHDQGNTQLQILNYKKAAKLGHQGCQDWLKKYGHDW